LVASTRNIGPTQALSPLENHQGSVISVEGYNSRIFHLGASYHSTTISSSLALRTRLFFKGEGMLGITSLTPHVGRIIYFPCNKLTLVNKAYLIM
jgi:hypothetical protein